MPKDTKVNVMFYGKHYNQKPTGSEVGYLQHKLQKTTISIKDLAYAVSSGCTFKPAYMDGTKSEDFISQQIFGLDFDHGTTIESELNKCKALGIMPVFGYTTFSHTPEEPHFRLVFLNNEVIYDIKKRRKLQYSLMEAFGFCDIKCKDETRMFFGGKSLILFEADNIIDGNSIIEKYYTIKESATSNRTSNGQKTKETSKANYKPTSKSKAFEIEQKVKAISELNVSEMKRLLKANSTENTVSSEIEAMLPKINTNNKPHIVIPKLDVKPSKFQILPKLDVKKTSYKIVSDLKVIKAQNKKIEPKLEIKPSNYTINTRLDISDSELPKHKINPNLNIEKKNDIEGKNKNDNDNDEYNTDLSPLEILIVISLLSILASVVHSGFFRDTDNKESISISINKNRHPPKSDSPKLEKRIFKCAKDLYDYISKEIDLTEYLGIGSKKVCCILPEHKDHDPSAHVFTNENGMQFYKCFGCGKARNIIGITEHLSGCKRSEAIEFIKNVYDLELVESDWTKQQKQLMIECANYLDTEEFKNEFPELYKLIRTRKSHIKLMLLHFSEMVNEDMQIEGKPFFFSSYPKLMEVCNIKNKTQIAQSLALFSLVHMLEKLPEDKIPQDDYRKAKAIAAKYGLKKVTGFYAFEEYGVNCFTNSEEKAIRLKKDNISLKGLSREWVYRTYGEDEANRVYPQYKYENSKGTSQKSDEHTCDIVKCIMYCIEKKGYATERDIAAILSKKYNYVTTEVQIKKSLQEILTTYSLKRVRANKGYKDKYNISGDGYPFIIICESGN